MSQIKTSYCTCDVVALHTFHTVPTPVPRDIKKEGKTEQSV